MVPDSAHFGQGGVNGFVCWECYTLATSQDGHILVTVQPCGEFIVLPQYDTKLVAPLHYIPLSHINVKLNCFLGALHPGKI